MPSSKRLRKCALAAALVVMVMTLQGAADTTTGDTTVTGTIDALVNLTITDPTTAWTFASVSGPNTALLSSLSGNVNIKANQDWQLTVKNETGSGHMYWEGGNYLTNALIINMTSTPANVNSVSNISLTNAYLEIASNASTAEGTGSAGIDFDGAITLNQSINWTEAASSQNYSTILQFQLTATGAS